MNDRELPVRFGAHRTATIRGCPTVLQSPAAECRDVRVQVDTRADARLGRLRPFDARFTQVTPPLDPGVKAHYGAVHERGRLFDNVREQLEFERIREILRRVLPAPARRGSRRGRRSRRARDLARGGRPHSQARRPRATARTAGRAGSQRRSPAILGRLGDARSLPASDSSADAVLLLGPLYHLDAEGRRLALAEALRVLCRDGVLVAAAISRFASLLDGLRFEWLAEEDFAAIVAQDLATGQHRNPDPVGRPEWFTTAWFHRPDELQSELADAGLQVEAVLAVEGPLWLLGDLDRRWEDDDERDRLPPGRAVRRR